ncbi:hypothetical protein H0H92_005150 [Tricholoma furcatifolium]|nr:hypothetical protein H0H92_005150 [Tricholoma furcatifolium]
MGGDSSGASGAVNQPCSEVQEAQPGNLDDSDEPESSSEEGTEEEDGDETESSSEEGTEEEDADETELDEKEVGPNANEAGSDRQDDEADQAQPEQEVTENDQGCPASNVKPLFSQIFNGVEVVSPLLTIDVAHSGDSQQGQKGCAKRRRTNKSTNISSFLDLEAEVSGDDDDETDEEDNLADFINDNDTDNASVVSDIEGGNDPSTMSHRALAHMMSIEAWHGETKRHDNTPMSSNVEHENLEEEQVVEPTDSSHDCPDVAPRHLVSNSLLPLLPRGELEPHLWRVSVRLFD